MSEGIYNHDSVFVSVDFQLYGIFQKSKTAGQAKPAGSAKAKSLGFIKVNFFKS